MYRASGSLAKGVSRPVRSVALASVSKAGADSLRRNLWLSCLSRPTRENGLENGQKTKPTLDCAFAYADDALREIQNEDNTQAVPGVSIQVCLLCEASATWRRISCVSAQVPEQGFSKKSR